MDELETEMAKAIDQVQRMLHIAENRLGPDPRSLALTRTQFETAFLWFANAVGGEPIFNG